MYTIAASHENDSSTVAAVYMSVATSQAGIYSKTYSNMLNDTETNVRNGYPERYKIFFIIVNELFEHIRIILCTFWKVILIEHSI